MMKLRKFRVTDFRSVEDSEWIEVDDVAALIGTNESGKTNILLPLWKLSPAKEGAISPTADYPRKLYNVFRHQTPKPIFIRALFEVDNNLATQLSAKTGLPTESMRVVEVARRFDGEYEVDFPNATPQRSVTRERIVALIDEAKADINRMTALKTEEDLKTLLSNAVDACLKVLPTDGDVQAEHLGRILATLDGVKTDSAPKTSTIVPRYVRMSDDIKTMQEEISRAHPRDVDAAVNLVTENLPSFVYYSTYGNLDSEIYLPHVIENLARKDLGVKEQAKARTLKVLFEFVRLQPTEILELGRDFKEPDREPTADEIAEISEKKKQRSILLQSASTLLTKQFREWWKQGEYRFRFEADGDHFRIWVSDDKRPEEIELEGRSTGLQWFLSFYLVFLVERADAHKGAILLLDEPGLSLHPLAQRDLSEFFEGLAQSNQLVYTCHSPFLVDADRLDRARKVYVDDNGTSKVTADLRAGSGNTAQRGAAYAVHAALGLSVAESLLLGCTPVIVEGPSDQHYLSGIKMLLISAGRLKPGRELVFPPAGGARGVKAVASIVGSRDEDLPVALFDSDSEGLQTASTLRNGLYAGDPSLVLDVGTFTGLAGSETEDLIPPSIIGRQLDRWQRGSEVAFADEVENGKPIVPQIEAWAQRHGVKLEKPGWKVELAKRVKQQLLTDGPGAIDEATLGQWTALFSTLQAPKETSATA
jgi:hypothetical protein